MIVWPGLRRSMGTRAGIPIANRAAHFDAALGITSSGGFASAWADQSGNGRSLLQATGANQPIHLDYAGTKYGWLPGVAGNYFSTPDSVVADVIGDIDLRAKVSMSNWSAGEFGVISKSTTSGNQRSYILAVATGGVLRGYFSIAGTSYNFATTSAAHGFAANETWWIRVTRASVSGDVNYYKSSDGSTWTQIGTTIAGTSGALYASTAQVTVGSYEDTSALFPGKIYQAQIYNGINGTLAVDFDPSRWTSGTTFPAATGETWTINSTGSKPAQIVDRPSLLFDGAAHYMKCAPFTLNQPATVFLVGRQITWTSTDTLLDGDSVNTGAITQTTGTPQININAGSSVAGNTEMTLATRKVICAVFNGASSSLQVTTGTATTGNAGAGNMGGITLGAAGSNLLFSNIQAYELLAYSAALDAATRANIIRALMSKHGVA